jgi:protoporphyrinogen oxidase
LPEGIVQGVPTRARSVLGSPLLSVGAKARALLRFAKPRQSKVDATTSVSDLLGEHFGAEWASKIARPLLSGVFSTPIEHLAAKSALPKLASWAASGASPRAMRDARPRLEAPVRGMQSLIDSIVDNLKTMGCELELDNSVVKFSPDAEGFAITTRSGVETSHQLVLAAPLATSLDLLQTKNSTGGNPLIPPMWAPMSMVILATKRLPKELAATGWLVTESNVFGLTAVTLLHEKWRRTPHEIGIFRLFFRTLESSQRDLERFAVAHVERVLGEPLDIDRTWVRRFEMGSFLRTPEHLKIVRDIVGAHAEVTVLGVESTGISSAIAEAKAMALGLAANFKSC